MLVQVISAKWCGRCQTIKPEVEALCKLNGAEFEVVAFEGLNPEEEATIKSLPTIRTRDSDKEDWKLYTANTLDQLKQDLATHSLKNVAYEEF
jgi:thiol-disulfide isomerase/thioredoxin